MIWAVSSILPVAPLAAVTVTSIGYEPSSAVVGGVAFTFTCPVAPASMFTVSARASAVGEAVTVHPSGPDGSNVNVCSSGVLLVIVRL